MAAASEPLPGALGVLTDLLGLRPASASRRDPGHTLGVVGGTDHPRFLLPLDHPPATTAACVAYNALRPTRTRATRRAVALAAQVGLDRRVAGTRFVADRSPGSLLAHLADLLGEPDVQVAVGVGNHDAVWKPTLQCFTPDGEPVAYVKVGLGPVAAELVTTERAALEAWDRLDDPRLVVPGLLATTVWEGTPIICTQPMPVDVRRLPPGVISPWPVRLLDAPLPDQPITAAPWWTERTRRHDGDAEVAGLLAVIEDRHRGPDRSWARWHGDWVPWNLARCSRGLVAWDWEYSEPGAPVGLDEVHGEYQHHRVLLGRTVADALQAARRVAPDAWVADAHLAMLLTRFARLRHLAGTEVGDHRAIVEAARGLLGPAPGVPTR